MAPARSEAVRSKWAAFLQGDAMVDTQGAQKAMQIAHQYLEEAKHRNGIDVQQINLALRYIAEARAKNPDVHVLLKPPKGGNEPLILTPSSLAAFAYLLLGSLASYDKDKDFNRQCIQYLKRSIELNPSFHVGYESLAEAYLMVNERKKALAVTSEGLHLSHPLIFLK
jgi:tetratricopeptide (TPR) repeat protein